MKFTKITGNNDITMLASPNPQAVEFNGNVYFLIPSRENRAPPISIFNTVIALIYNKWLPQFKSVNQSSVIQETRTQLLLGIEGRKVLMLDDDIVIHNSVEELINIFHEADIHGYNIIGNYYDAQGHTVLCTAGDEPQKIKRLNNEDLKNVKQYDIMFGGLGFYYGKTPNKPYKFTFDNGLGEDLNFFMENKLEPRIDLRLKLGHQKSLEVFIP
jgi:hypothetical protein